MGDLDVGTYIESMGQLPFTARDSSKIPGYEFSNVEVRYQSEQ